MAQETPSILPMLEALIPLLIDGTLHQGISREQLAYYLDEFTFRFNQRTSASRGLLFYRLLQQCTNTDPVPLKNLISSASAD